MKVSLRYGIQGKIHAAGATTIKRNPSLIMLYGLAQLCVPEPLNGRLGFLLIASNTFEIDCSMKDVDLNFIL
ncbi:hypothetical protein CEXT_373581, partial [Caerostris extrusa]